MGQPWEVGIRTAVEADGRALVAINDAAWEPESQPTPRASSDEPFFTALHTPGDVLVAEAAGAVLGYVRIEPLPGPAAAQHVMIINGLAVAPSSQGQGLGRQLVDAALATARDRNARKVVLHVLSTNHRAIALYRRAGFEQEGCLVRQFQLDGHYVDDLILARHLENDG